MKPYHLLKCFLSMLPLMCYTASASAETKLSVSAEKTQVTANDNTVEVRYADVDVLKYERKKPADSACISPSACYFHPLTTPAGVVITDVAPDDHLHHRGVFLAWLEMRGSKGDGDFWGWGKYATVEKRQIVNKEVSNLVATGNTAAFTVTNDWQGDATSLLKENLKVKVTFMEEARVYDLSYELTPTDSLTLGKHAFSGFSVRTRKDAEITAHDPAGAVSLPAPSHMKPETDWPARPWYAFEMKLTDGKQIGVAVINHPNNPPTLWHNVTKIGLLNPCIIAPASVQLSPDKPLNLRYQVITFDGAIPTALLDKLAAEFEKSK